MSTWTVNSTYYTNIIYKILHHSKQLVICSSNAPVASSGEAWSTTSKDKNV